MEKKPINEGLTRAVIKDGIQKGIQKQTEGLKPAVPPPPPPPKKPMS